MILVDTGPLVALFDPRDPSHRRSRRALKRIRAKLRTTMPVLTEAFHLLTPGTRGARALAEFVEGGGAVPWFFDQEGMHRALQLMDQYADHPMDFADASLVVAAERLRTSRVMTLDRGDFHTYRLRRGHRHLPFEVIRC